MSIILAIDPAWTLKEPSAVALIEGEKDRWNCLALAPSYETFIDLAEGKPVDWLGSGAVKGSQPEPARIYEAATALTAGRKIDLITIDMPVSRIPFSSRRKADQAISANFGAAGCSTHSPTAERPGNLSQTISKGFQGLGFPVAGADTLPGSSGLLLEVYPHTALLALMQVDRRVKYKVQKRSKYWPDASPQKHREKLVQQYSAILNALGRYIEGMPLKLPDPESVPFKLLKRFEDGIDALICSWVGIYHLNKRAKAYGDEDAAIWAPFLGEEQREEEGSKRPAGFLCPECGSTKNGGSLMVTSTPSGTDPWHSVLQVLFCNQCKYGIPAHLGERWRGINSEQAREEWQSKYRIGAPKLNRNSYI